MASTLANLPVPTVRIQGASSREMRQHRRMLRQARRIQDRWTLEVPARSRGQHAGQAQPRVSGSRVSVHLFLSHSTK